MATLGIAQVRFYSDGNENNTEKFNLTGLEDNEEEKKLIHTDFCSNEAFKDFIPIRRLGIQTLPGTRFYLNGNTEPVIVGPSGVYELDLSSETSAVLSSLSFDIKSMEIINNLSNGYLIIDMIYNKEDGTA